MSAARGFRLVRPPMAAGPAPVLDSSQHAVVDHTEGPLLVLAGPGTGKTTTLVEAVAARIDGGMRPDEVLVLTFGRKAADELRERIVLRLDRTLVEPAAFTFHGFCHAVMRMHAAQMGEPPPRLLSGAERDVRVSELLHGNAAGEGTTRWPSDLAPALRLRGFARELSDLLDRARERGLDGAGLRELGQREQRPAWVSAGEFLDEYLNVLDARRELDYAGLIGQATDLLAGPIRQRARQFRAVYVDEYQDTDPAQERLLRLLAGDGRTLVVVGDPDQAIYGFRGATVDNIVEFPERFRRTDGQPAPVVPLDTCRRMSGELLGVSRELARKIPMGALNRNRKEHRSLHPAGPDAACPPRIRLFASMAEEVAAISDELRRAHLVEGMPWDAMAVLVRSGVRSIPVLKRALVAASVPVTVAADEVVLADDPAIAPLLGAVEVALAVASGEPGKLARAFTPEIARVLLLSPLAEASPSGLRALGRRLRESARAAGQPTPPPSPEMVRDAVLHSDGRSGIVSDAAGCDGLEEWLVAPVRKLSRLLTDAARLVAADASPDEVLWPLWDGSGWARRLEAAAIGTGPTARAANRDLDAVVALFDAASRLADRQPRATVTALLNDIAAQQIPAGPMAERPSAHGSVRLLTAHRSKGLEWDLVVVAGVQEGVWPDLRSRGALLDADAVGADRDGRPVLMSSPTPAQLLADERRLLYVATTRARRRLIVTAVSGIDDESERPSRFLEELGLPMPEAVEPSGVDLLSAASLVARLRRALTDEDQPASVRDTAAGVLAELAVAVDSGGVPLVPAADPSAWWGMDGYTTGPAPIRQPDEPLRLSGSAVNEFGECPRRWFLAREVHARGTSSSAQGFGSVVHALAEAVVTGQLPADRQALVDALTGVWPALPFGSAWESSREHHAAVEAIDRFLRWHHSNGRQLLAAEQEFSVGHSEDVLLHGRADRVERDEHGRVVVVDLKTSKNAKKKDVLATDAQLGVYQLAVRAGAFRDLDPGPPGGAELVQLRQEVRGEVRVQAQSALPPPPESTWADELVERTATSIRAEHFPARPNDHCGHCEFRTSCPAAEAGDQVIR